MKSYKEYKRVAWDRLSGNWAQALLSSVVFLTLEIVISSVVSVKGAIGLLATLVGLFTLGNLSVGMQNAYRIMVENGDYNLTTNIFKRGFCNGYIHKLCGYLLSNIVVCVGLLLFLVPGLIWSFAYSMTPYILDERPELSIVDAMKESRMMMRGHKLDLFFLFLSFIGWILLVLVTLGIAAIWAVPYIQTAMVEFYEDLK